MWYRGDVPREVLSPAGPPGRLVQSFPGNFYSWLCCPRWTSLFSHHSTRIVNSSANKPRLRHRIAYRHSYERQSPNIGVQKEGNGEGHGLDFSCLDQGHAEGNTNYTSGGGSKLSGSRHQGNKPRVSQTRCCCVSLIRRYQKRRHSAISQPSNGVRCFAAASDFIHACACMSALSVPKSEPISIPSSPSNKN